MTGARSMRLLRVFAIFTFPVVLIWFVATLTVVGSIWWWGDWLGKRSSAYPIVWRAAYLVFAAGSVALARFAWTLPRVQMHVCEMGEWEWCVDASPLAAAQERYDRSLLLAAIAAPLVTFVWMLLATWIWHGSVRAAPARGARERKRLRS